MFGHRSFLCRAFKRYCSVIALTIITGCGVRRARFVCVPNLGTFGADVKILFTLVCPVVKLQAFIALSDFQVLLLYYIVVRDNLRVYFDAFLLQDFCVLVGGKTYFYHVGLVDGSNFFDNDVVFVLNFFR